MNVSYKINKIKSPQTTDLEIRDLNGFQLDAIRSILLAFAKNNTLFSEDEKLEFSLDNLIRDISKDIKQNE